MVAMVAVVVVMMVVAVVVVVLVVVVVVTAAAVVLHHIPVCYCFMGRVAMCFSYVGADVSEKLYCLSSATTLQI
jgi:hypothetical protein